ncbi:hairy and enhancer of split-related 15, tandem duplicate 1 [Triplophysa rosa]|uniref:Transcription factor HES-5 n=1 Tax=Triplophysa rosa TaxID=992332 RepID=A0A9W7TAV0_TRIRA|nr:hairy and enhancer of split-related 15, tandem duplicate 1 [Triplophysa rosa]KAI7795028.1 putative transcription factor HES-5-like [Triplophysa rosa]
MAPTYTTDYSTLSNKDKHKMRKPAVEKMRRDRINNCIEQLKTMLEKEFHQQDPNTKLEKADILEMTVVFLKQQLQPKTSAPQKTHFDGYSQCWRETMNYLSVNSKTDGVRQHLNRCQEAQRSAKDVSLLSPVSYQSSKVIVKQEPCAHTPLWRPW